MFALGWGTYAWYTPEFSEPDNLGRWCHAWPSHSFFSIKSINVVNKTYK